MQPFVSVIEAVWFYAKEHEGTYVSRRVAEELFDRRLYTGHLFDNLPLLQSRRAWSNADWLKFFSNKGLLIQWVLQTPPGGREESRRSYQAGREPHYFVVYQVVWDAIATAARLGDLQGLP